MGNYHLTKLLFMKNFLLSLAFFLSMVAFLSNCKDKEMYDVEAEVAQNQDLNNLNNSNNNQNNLLQSNNPIIITTSGTRGFDDAPYNYTSKYDFSSSKAIENNFVYSDDDNTYDFYINKYYQVEGSDDARAYIKITDFDPVVGINNAYIEVFFSNYYVQTDILASLRLYQSGYLNDGSNDNIVVNSFSFDKTTRVINIDLTVNATEANPQNSSDNASTTRFQYSGILTPNNIVYRTALNP
jgi:hypothetical protein